MENAPAPPPRPDDNAPHACFSGDLVKRYDEKQVHADSFKLELKIDIRADSTHGILGHSGSGKSTLLNLLATLDLPSSESRSFAMDFRSHLDRRHSYAWRDNRWRETGKAKETEVPTDRIRRRHFGFVFQAGHLSPNLSAAQNVMFPLALANIDRREARARAADLLSQVGLAPRLHRALPRNLSGGEYQRVAVARAIAHDPDVVFADEPTGNLDPDAGVMVMETLQTWRRAGHGRTLILVTHNIDQALGYCDRLTILRGGAAVSEVEHDGAPRPLPDTVSRNPAERDTLRLLIASALKAAPHHEAMADRSEAA